MGVQTRGKGVTTDGSKIPSRWTILKDTGDFDPDVMTELWKQPNRGTVEESTTILPPIHRAN